MKEIDKLDNIKPKNLISKNPQVKGDFKVGYVIYGKCNWKSFIPENIWTNSTKP